MRMRFVLGSAALAGTAVLVSQMNATAGVDGGQVSGPDVITHLLANNEYNNGSDNDIAEYGQSGGIYAYSFATTSCNIGNQTGQWISGGGGQHPVIGQNMFRLKNGRFEQLGQSWLKHSFCAVSEPGCAPCSPTGCSSLGIGCADTYWATLNDGSGGGPKYLVNAATGSHTHPFPSPSGTATIRGRLQVHSDDITPALNSGAKYFIEGQYVTYTDEPSDNRWNNASWRQINVISPTSLATVGSTVTQQPGIMAWKVWDASVTIQAIDVSNDGRILVAYRVTPVGDQWHYEYAIQNLNSDRSVGSVEIDAPGSATLSNIGFHDVDYHSGEPYSGTDWPGNHDTGNDIVSWATQTFGENANSNAIRWGTLYNFRFDANQPPVEGNMTLGLFKPGSPDSTSLTVLVPDAGGPAPCAGNANKDNVVDVFDLLEVLDNFGSCAEPCPDFCGADVNEDCEVDVFDLLDVLDNFGPCP